MSTCSPRRPTNIIAKEGPLQNVDYITSTLNFDLGDIFLMFALTSYSFITGITLISRKYDLKGKF